MDFAHCLLKCLDESFCFSICADNTVRILVNCGPLSVTIYFGKP